MILLMGAGWLSLSAQAQQPGGLQLQRFFSSHERVLGLPLTYHPEPKPYSFLAGGHWYGAHENHRSLAPAASLLAAIPAMRELRPTFVFALGDVVRNADDQRQIDLYEQTLLNLGQSAIIVPGNHDLDAHGHPAFGLGTVMKCFESFGDLFLMLETEQLLQGGGRQMLQDLEETTQRCQPGRNLFVFSHRLLWALTEPGFREMDAFANEPIHEKVAADTLKMVYAAVLKLAGDRPMHWFSGDVGASWSWNVFSGHSEDGQRHFYAAGLGDCEDDAFWEVRVDSLGNVEPRVFWLVPHEGRDSLPHDQAFWRKLMNERQATKASNWAVRWRKGWKFVALGLVVGASMVLVLQWIRQRKKSKT